MSIVQATARAQKKEDASESLRRHGSANVPVHLPPVPEARPGSPDRCACGGGCPRCVPFSSLIRSAVEETSPALPEHVEGRLRARFAQPLPDIRVHTGPNARRATDALGTRAFTVGRDIVWDERRAQLDTPDGLSLLSHETAHVLQQDSAGSGGLRASSPADLEKEARAAGAGDARETIRPDARAAGQVQMEEPGIPWSLRHPFTSRGMFQLRMDPEIERDILRMSLRRWMLNLDSPSEAEEESSPSPGVPSPDAVAARPGPLRNDAGPVLRPLPDRWFGMNAIGPHPDIGALLAPFAHRGAGVGSGDLDVAMRIFQDRYRFVSSLPDLRDLVPDFARSWVPTDWRRSIAQTLTAMTISNALRHDHPTVIESADRMLFQITRDPGVLPTYIYLPSITFDF